MVIRRLAREEHRRPSGHRSSRDDQVAWQLAKEGVDIAVARPTRNFLGGGLNRNVSTWKRFQIAADTSHPCASPRLRQAGFEFNKMQSPALVEGGDGARPDGRATCHGWSTVKRRLATTKECDPSRAAEKNCRPVWEIASRQPRRAAGARSAQMHQ
jgi:hypothetical protein